MTDTQTDQETPQATQRMKLSKEREERMSSKETMLEWVEVMPEPRHKKGGKVLYKTLTSSGNGSSVYVGREASCTEYLSKMKREGKLGEPDSKAFERAKKQIEDKRKAG